MKHIKALTKSRRNAIILSVAALSVILLVIDHWAHVFGYLPYLLLLACPLMHLFMMRHDHDGHGGASQENSRRDTTGDTGI